MKPIIGRGNVNLPNLIENKKVKYEKCKILTTFIFRLFIYGSIELDELIKNIYFLFETYDILAAKTSKRPSN